MVPLILCVGFVVDYSRISLAREQLQNAANSTVLALAGDTDATEAQLKATAAARMATMVPGSYQFTVEDVSRASSTITLKAKGSMDATLMSIAGFGTLEQSVTSKATWGTWQAGGGGCSSSISARAARASTHSSTSTWRSFPARWSG